MKIALLGKGKTGSKVAELAKVTVFDSQNQPTFETLSSHDVIVSFLPGEAFTAYIPLLLETKIPVVTGSTGFSWPEGFDETLKQRNLGWIYASNFSMGVVVMKSLIQKLSSYSHLFNASVSIHEIHHTKKLDAPSGTALSMKEWWGKNCEVTSERTGDVIGFHELTFDTGSEVIRLSHEALDRKLFAEGALWAANFITTNKIIGLHSFQSVIERGTL
jgi:4-hydroxy-tetrahydrodipicolinate reductase